MHYLCLFFNLLSLPVFPPLPVPYIFLIHLSLYVSSPLTISLTSYIPLPPPLSLPHVCVLCHDTHLFLIEFIPPLSTFFILVHFSLLTLKFSLFLILLPFFPPLTFTLFFFLLPFKPTASATACVTPTWCSSFTTRTPSSSWPSPSFCSTPTCTVQTSSPTARCCWRTSYAIYEVRGTALHLPACAEAR